MTLFLERQADTNLPVEVDGFTPDQLVGKSEKEIAAQKVWFGRRSVEIGEIFSVKGDVGDNQTIVWQGDLESVHLIGAGMNRGTTVVESAAGRHVGSRMSGGTLVARSDVSDFAGSEMMGGLLRIDGNAGDGVGGNYSGSKVGMNRGTILVSGNVGLGAGQRMRRGTIAVASDAGRLCGWNMLAGSILVFGKCGVDCGAGMIRGSIVLAGSPDYQTLPSFSRGGTYEGYLMRLMADWLAGIDFEPAKRLLGRSFCQHHGDLLNGGRGELFIG